LNPASPEIVFAATTDPAQVHALLAEAPQWEQQNAAREAQVVADELQIETPDSELNRALTSAEIALDEAWQCSDQLGCGYVAGYGPSRRNRRPQYAWFFAGDGIVDMRAALAAGDYERARDELNFIAKYQDAQNGMIWHELTLSAPYIDWRGAYPYMFVHADITFAYISAIEEYVRTSGDQNFLRQSWPSVEKAFSYCRGLVSADDGLPHIPPGQQGGDEQDQLTDELLTSASWVSATEAYAHLAELMTKPAEVAQARQMGERARQAIATHYWSAEHNFWIQGHLRNGQPMESRSSGAVETITEHLFNQTQTDHVLEELASWRFQSDWGTRSIALGESAFDPNSYGKGSVWGLGTAEMANAFWTAHRPLTAWQIWRTLPQWSSLDSMGHIHEVLAGDTYHPQLESVPEQTWSSAAFLSTFVRGLLGITVDGEHNQLTFAPHLPADWQGVTVQHVKAGTSSLDLALTHSINSIRLRAVNHGDALHLIFDPELPMGAQVLVATLNGKKIHAVPSQQNGQDLHARIELELPRGESQIELTLRDGVALAFDAAKPSFGDVSKAMKPIMVRFEGDTLTIAADVMPSEENRLHIFTRRKLLPVSEGTMRRLGANQYEVVFPKSLTKTAYERRQMELKFAGSAARR
jgi:glycogen debranching enzyme